VFASPDGQTNNIHLLNPNPPSGGTNSDFIYDISYNRFEQGNDGLVRVFLDSTTTSPYRNGRLIGNLFALNVSDWNSTSMIGFKCERCADWVIENNVFSGGSSFYRSNAATTNGSGVITSSGATFDDVDNPVRVGMYAFGRGIPMGAKVASVDTSEQITLDQNVVGSNTGVKLYIDKGLSMYFDADCTNISLKRNHLGTAGVPSKPVYLCARSEITCEPAVRVQSPPLELTSWGGTARSTSTGTLNMDNQMATGYPEEMPPKGYMLRVAANDSASSTTSVILKFAKDSTNAGTAGQFVQWDLKGIPNDEKLVRDIYVDADSNGDIYWDITASGAGTLDIWISVLAVYM
jgi:hypothetical protein